MTEYIGSRISLISKRDIRYVGTLHEISSENSTVALEQVVSFGTEGRRPDDEVPPSDNVYEYIVFRGSDVKDLSIEEPPKENKPPKAPQVPDDPAILGSARRPTPSSSSQAPSQQPPQQQPQQRQQPPPRFPQQPPFPYYYGPPLPQRFGQQGFPPGPGFPGMPYGAPPGWYPPPGQGFPHPPPGQFFPHQMPMPAGQQQRTQGPQPPQITPVGPATTKEQSPVSQQQSPERPVATVKLPSTSTPPALPSTTPSAPPPPTNSKPDIVAALAPPAPVMAQDPSAPTVRAVPTRPKSGRIMPAIPLLSPRTKPHVPANGPVHSNSDGLTPVVPLIANGPLQSTPANTVVITEPQPKAATTHISQVATKSFEDANRDARAAVAAAMAKLPPAPVQKPQTNGEGAMDNLTKKVNEMRTNDNIRTSRQPGTGGYVAGHRGGGRGGYRGGRNQVDQQGKKVEIPTTDYDFASANAKFNKQDLVKEAIATGSPIEAPTTNGPSAETTMNGTRKESEQSVIIPASVGYNKGSSFFDNISSESKDRDDDNGKRLGGREFRSEEQKKNVETFGQGSVDNGYRGGFRGRGRGRGYGRGRGGLAARGGRGATRGGRGTVAAES